MMMKFWVILVGVSLCGGFACGESGDDDDDSSESVCSETACFAACMENQWTDDAELWQKRTAHCDAADNCQCLESCDDERCRVDYCQVDQGLSGGSCVLLGCVCETDSDSDTETDSDGDSDTDSAP